MFLCPGLLAVSVRWMNNNKRDNCQVINYFGLGYPETKVGAGVNLCLEGSHGPRPRAGRSQSYGTQAVATLRL